MTEIELLFKRLRARLTPGTRDSEYADWIRQQPCSYAGFIHAGKCAGDVVADHVLGGYHGKKSSGLLLVPACVFHNNRAEADADLHKMVLPTAIELRMVYDEERLTPQ